MLASLAIDALNEVNQRLSAVQSVFISSGASRSTRMVLEGQRHAAEVFREAANTMATKARAYAGADVAAVVDLVDDELRRLVEAVVPAVNKRTSASGLSDSERLSQNFAAELTRLKDDAVRDLRHLPADVPIGMTINVTGTQGHVNVAAGAGNVATQVTSGTSGREIIGILAQVRGELAKQTDDTSKIIDVTDEIEHLEQEAAKPAPDKGRLLRYAKRIGETAERVGIAIAPKLLEALLKAAQ